MSKIIYEGQTIQKEFKDYIIYLITNKDLINIQIQKIDSYEIYESNFYLEYLKKNKLLMPIFTIEEMIQFIEGLINQKNIKIEKNNTDLKFILISTLPIVPNVELILNKKEIKLNDIIEKFMSEIKNVKDENKKLKRKIENDNKKLINENNILKKRIESIENDNKILKKKIEKIENENKRLNTLIEENNKKNIKIPNKNKELKNIINKVNVNMKPNKKIESHKKKSTNYILKYINSIKPHKSYINSVSIFPSGNIISVSEDKSIKIYDIHLNELQTIENAHNDSIINVEIKDENNFITCSSDKSIRLWIKNEKINI